MAVRSVIFDIIGKDSASPAFRRVAASADAAAASLSRSEKALARTSAVGASMSAVGGKLTKGLTLPLAALGAVAIKQASDFQKSMTLLQTAGGESQKNMGVVAAGIKKIAVQTGTSLGQLGQGMYTVEKAGIRGADGLKVLKAAAEGAKAENVDLGTATNALTSVMMSYHLGADKAVATQNALVVGAGKAKTTMQEYAASLATVVPTAAAAGIKFSQVAGAIATLTQHGTSAAEATQELAFTIRNLQAPNNVAVAAMGQLGISALDVSRNLGTRGLTGTLQFIESKLPRTGLVYLNTMKQMASGTQDLTVMQSKMSPQLAQLSAGFLKGTVSAAEYRKAFRGMSADGYAQGSAFLALAGKMKGYNDSLRAGTPAQKTMAQELKAIFGGAVGLNTALQLGGHNMAYFKTATDEVAKAAAKGGANIATWAKTQNTLAVRADQAKAKMQVLAVNIGQQLMPIALKAVSVFSRMVDWFSHLSSGTQSFIIKAGVLAAVLGPVVAIVGRLISTGARLAGFFIAGATSLFRFAAGARMAEISLAGMQTRSYAAGLKMSGVFSTILGLATRFPLVTAAVAAVGVAVGVGAAMWGRWHSEANAVAAATKKLTAALDEDGHAIGRHTRLVAASALQQNGAFRTADRLGISLNDLTSAYLRQPAAMSRVSSQLNQIIREHTKYSVTARDARGNAIAYTTSLDATGRAALVLSNKLEIGTKATARAKSADDQATRSKGQLAQAMGGVSNSAYGSANAMEHATSSANRLTGAIRAVPSKNVHVAASVSGLANVETLLRDIAYMPASKTSYIKAVVEHDTFNNTYTNSQPTSRRYTQAGGTVAAFGTRTIPPNSVFTVGEAGWEGGYSDAHGRVSIFSNQQSKAMGFAEPKRYANGTPSSNTSGITVNQYFYEQKDPQSSGQASLRRLRVALR